MRTRVIQGDRDGGTAEGTPPDPGGRPRRDGLLAAGAVTAVLGIGALALGGVLLGVNVTQRDDAGFYDDEGGALSTTTRALVSPDVNVEADAPGWLVSDGRLGAVRITATGARDGPLFVGIGPRRDVEAYLAGVAHEEADFDGAGGPRRIETGTAVPPPPASQRFWAVSSAGAGTRTVVWPIDEGDWSAVVMNADGSAGVRTTTRVALRTDAVLWLAIGGVISGIALAGTATALLAAGRRRQPSAAARSAPAT